MAEDLKKLVEKGISRGYSLEKIQSDFANAGWGEAYLNNIPVYYNELKKKSPVGPKDAGVLPSRQGDTRFSSESQLQQDKYAGVGNVPLSDPLLKKKDGLADSLFKILNQAQKDADNTNKYVPQIQKLWNDYSSIERGPKSVQNFFTETGNIDNAALEALKASSKRNSQRAQEEAKAIAKDDGVFETFVKSTAAGLLGVADYFSSLYQKSMGIIPFETNVPTSFGETSKALSDRAKKAQYGRKLLEGFTEEEINDGFGRQFAKGNYSKALSLAGSDFVELLPQVGLGLVPVIGLPTMISSAGGGAWEDVRYDDKYSMAEKMVYAPLIASAEFFTEKFFGMDRRMAQDFLSKAFGKTVKSASEVPKKDIGDLLFKNVPKALRAPLEEGLEEGIVSTFQQTLDNIMAGKSFDPYEIAESAILGAGAGGSTYALVRGGSALLQTPVFNDVYTITNNVNKINELLKSEDIVPEEKEILSNRLNQFKTQLNQLRNEASDYYKPFSQEDKQRTLELNQAITKGMRTYGAMKTPEAKAEVVNTIRQSLAEKAQIEQKYDSTQKQQVPSPVVQGAQPGGVPIQGTSAEAPQAGGVLQVPSQQEEEIVKKTREVEASTPSASVKPVSTTLNENNYQGIIGSVRQYVDNLSDNLFETLGTSRQQVMNGVDSIANVLSSFAKSNRQIPITIYATEEAWKRGTGEQDVSRGMYVEGKVEGQPTKISIFLPALVGNTVYHEGLHDVVPKVFGVEGINEVSRTLSKAITQDPALASELAWFASKYDADENAEEFLVQLASLVSAGDIDIEVTKSLATRFMEAVAKVLGIAGIKMNPSSAQLSKALIEYAQRLGAGVALEEQQFDVKQKKGESPSFSKTFQGLVDRAGEIKTSSENIDEVEDMLEGNTEPGPVAPTQELKNPVKYEKIIKTRNSYKLSYVNPTNVVDIEKLIDEIVSEGKTVLFWAGDQLGVGEYTDPFTKKKYDLQGGPSYMLNPTNVKRGAVWATGLSAKSLSERIKRDKIDYVFIISGGPLSMMFFNGLVLDMWADRAQSAFKNIDLFKESLSKAIVGKKSEALNDFNSWGELKEGLKNKKTLNKTRNVIKGLAETKTKRGLEFLNQYGLSFENFDGLRDGYFKDNNFDILDITTIYKPTVAIDGQSNHLTYPNVVMGELVGIPNRKVSSRDVMTEDFLSSVTKKGKERRGLPPSQIIKAIAGEIGMVQGVSRPRKAKRMKISGIPKFVETLDIRITPATTARVQIRVPDKNKNDIKKLSEKYNKLLTDYSKSGDNSHLRRIDEVASQIMDGAKKRLKDNISRVRGAAIQFGDDYVGIWNKIFEPSLKVKLRITPESNEAAISRELALFAERYNQDGIIIETASEMEQQWINGEIDMPLAYDDKNGFTHFPQLLHNFEKELSDQQLADLSLKLKDEGVSFSMNRDELIVSIFPELEPNQKNLSENEQYRAKERIFNDTFDKVTRSINDILRSNEEITPSIRIAKSIYIGGEETSRKWRSDKGGAPKGKTYDTRTYNRSNFLKAFKEGLSNEEKLIPEFVALRNEEIQLSKQKKKLLPEKQARYDALRKIIQPLAESTFATNKNFYRATRLELNSIAEKYANEVDGAFASTFSIKRPARAAVKTLRWYGAATDELGDGARVNIIVRNEKDADKLFEKLDNDFPAKGKEERRVRQETELGYPKRLLEVRNDLGFIGEIQVMTMNGYLAKDGVSYFNPERKDDARDSLKKVQERIGWNIPDGLGHYFYEINRDENIDDSLRNQALFLSKGYYSAFNDPNFNLEEDYFFAEIADFKKKVDNADKSNWDEGNKGESPISLNRYLRSKGVKVPSKKTKKQIIGDNSKMSSWVKESKFKAVMMEEEGIDSERIYFATGWERGADKYWRYEVAPIRLTQKGVEDLIDKDDIVSLASLIEARPSNMPRSKDNETLLDFYPQLKDVDVLIAPYGSRTFYSYNEKVIQISKNVVDLGMDEFYLTIVHEVQHAVQHIEGFAVGAGLSSVESQLRSAITDAYDLRMTALAKSESIADDYQMVYEDFLTDKENAEGEEIKDLPNSDSFIAYDKYKTYVEIVNSATFEYNFLEDLLKTRMQPNGKELITDFELYMAFAGEAEARNASRRAKMSKEERRSTPLSRSEDIVRDEQIVQYPGEVTSPKVKRQVTAWHGSPYDFEAFKSDKIGTGEGAQAFGWGLYFTDLESIAKEYASHLSNYISANNLLHEFFKKEFGVSDKVRVSEYQDGDLSSNGYELIFIDTNYFNNEEVSEAFFNNKGYDKYLKQIKRELEVVGDVSSIKYNKDYDQITVRIKQKQNKYIYGVSLHKGKTPDQYTWLEWDRGVDRKIENKAQELFEKEYPNKTDYYGRPIDLRNQYYKDSRGKILEFEDSAKGGEKLYRSLAMILGSAKEASLFLLRAGIDGIKYPAESRSRGTTSDTARGFNYVVFDENAVTIDKKIKLQKIAKAQGSQLEAQMYGYLLSISQKQPDNTYKLPFTLDDFLSYMVPTFSRQRATEIYENVSKGVTPEKVVKSVPSIDDAYDASKKLLDSQKNKKMFTWDAARKFFLDRQATLKAAILKAGMKNAYNLLVNRAGSGARANYFFSKQEKAIYDGLSSKDIEALDKIIMLRRIAEIDKNFDVRGEKRPIHPNKLNFESAQIGLAEKRKDLGDAKFNELNDRANQYFDAFKSLLDSMYDEGLINEDLYNRLKNLDYQPRMFIEHVFDMDELSMRDINLSANQVKRIKDGSEDEIMFDSRFLLAVYSKSTFSRIARNKVNRAIAEATSVNGNEEWISKDPKKQFSEVTYFEDGVRKQFYIKSSLKGELDDVQRFGAIPPESQKYVGLLSGSYLLKLLATRANPLFVFRNIPRDYLHVLFFTNVYDNMNMPLAMYRLAGDAIKGVKGKIKDDQDYKDFIEYGGGMEYLSTEGKEGMMTNRSLLNRTIEKLGSAGELSEIAFRLGMYKRLVQESLKNFDGTPTEEQLAQIKVEAVTKSREMIDFAQGGVATKTLESAVPYINAAFQGFRVSSAYIKNNPKEFVIKLGQLAIGLAVIAMYNAVMGDDDMEDIPEDVKRKYFIIMTPFTEEKDGKTVRKYIKIAKTQQLIPFISSLDMSLEGNLIAPFMGREPRFNEDTIKQSWDAFLSYFPKDPTKPLDEALSSVPLFSALAAYKMNYDTYRKRIVSTDYQDKNVLPAYEDFTDKNVPYFYKAIGQAVDAGPKRLQVATEKFITTPYSSLITMGGYTLMDAIASNVYEVKGPGGYTPAEQEAISNKALKSAGINAEKIFIGTTDPDHKIYNKREQIERINLEASTERRGLKLQAKELGGKYFTAKEQGDAKGMNEALEAIKNARIEVRNKAVEDKNKQDYDYFNDALKTNMRFGPTFPQEYNDITFATDNEARAKIIAIRDMNMTQKELIDYLVDYKRKTGKSIDIRTIIREYDKFVTNEKK